MSNRNFRTKHFDEIPSVDVQQAFKKYTKQLKIIAPQFTTTNQPNIMQHSQTNSNNKPTNLHNVIHQHRVNNNFSTISEQPNLVYQLKPNNIDYLNKRSQTSQSNSSANNLITSKHALKLTR